MADRPLGSLVNLSVGRWDIATTAEGSDRLNN
jgi:hypothetical protein